MDLCFALAVNGVGFYPPQQRHRASLLNAWTIVGTQILSLYYPSWTFTLSRYSIWSMMVYSAWDIVHSVDCWLRGQRPLNISYMLHHVVAVYLCNFTLQQSVRIILLASRCLGVMETSTIFLNFYLQSKDPLQIDFPLPRWYGPKLALMLFGASFIVCRFGLLNVVLYRYQTQYYDIPTPALAGIGMFHLLHVFWCVRMWKQLRR
ncbi:MAG: TLC domain-containing protein [Nitrososphaerales archaeon]